MKPPRHVKVGCHTYKVAVEKHGLMSDMGHCDVDAGVIGINGQQYPSAMRDTLTHELLHACLAPMNLDEDTEERIVSVLAPTWLGVIRDNPKLVDWLRA